MGRQESFCVRTPEDEFDCWVRSLDVTPDGRILMVDCYNKNLKIFSEDKEYMTSLTFPSPYGPVDIAVVDDDEAVVNLCQETQLYVVDIQTCDPKICYKIQLDFTVRAVSCLGDKLVVCTSEIPAFLKLIDKRGRTYWSRNPFYLGETLFSSVANITCCLENDNPIVIVADSLENSVVKLNGETGDVIKFCGVYGKSHEGICVDERGIVYLCYGASDEICAWNLDLNNRRVLLTTREGLGNAPSCLKYTATKRQLMIAYTSYSDSSNNIDCYPIKY